MNPVFVGSSFVAKYPTGGGNFWVPVQYLLGLRALGVEAYWLELLWPQSDVARARRFWRRSSATWRRSASPSGSPSCSSPTMSTTSRPDERSTTAPHPRGSMGPRARRPPAQPGQQLPASLRGRFARTALFDIDPGQFQLWARDYDLGVGGHDAYLTIGQNLGAPDSPVPLGGVPWQRVWPAVHLPAWPEQPASGAARYTTVTQWWSEGCTVLGGEMFEGHKRTSFLRVLDLPRHVPVQLELAANIHPEETEDRRLSPRPAGTSPTRRWWRGRPRPFGATCSSHGASSAAPSPPT